MTTIVYIAGGIGIFVIGFICGSIIPYRMEQRRIKKEEAFLNEALKKEEDTRHRFIFTKEGVYHPIDVHKN